MTEDRITDDLGLISTNLSQPWRLLEHYRRALNLFSLRQYLGPAQNNEDFPNYSIRQKFAT